MKDSSESSALASRLRRRLQLLGPISLADFMAMAMIGGNKGYYTSTEPIGAKGDFITAPEISQMFGELIGLWCVDAWNRINRPDPFLLVECGPGRGTLMADLMRAASKYPEFVSAARLHLIEINEPMLHLQKQILHSYSPTWHRDISTLPEAPAIILGNEFLDVFPAHQFQMTQDGWRERAVALKGDKLVWTLAAPGPQIGLLRQAHRNAAPGQIAEVSPAAHSFIAEVARRSRMHGGAALFVDYGSSVSGLGDTFQAIKQHQPVDALTEFGKADLSVHVDFEPLVETAQQLGLNVFGPISQREFLLNLGIEIRASRLSQSMDDAQRSLVRCELDRLIGPDQMGNLFKVIAFKSPSDEPLVGFS